VSDNANPQPGGSGLFGSLPVLLLRFLFTFPYTGLVGLATLAFVGRDRLVAHAYALEFQRDGEPFPDPLPPTEELRRRFLERLPNPEGLVREPDVYAAEGWLALSVRFAWLATLAAASAVLAGAGFLAWHYGRPWAQARGAADPWSGVPLVVAATVGAWAAAGWLALGALALTANWGPVPWFADWAMARANRELFGSAGSPEAAHRAGPP
jgi:hypothetical protein